MLWMDRILQERGWMPFQYWDKTTYQVVLSGFCPSRNPQSRGLIRGCIVGVYIRPLIWGQPCIRIEEGERLAAPARA